MNWQDEQKKVATGVTGGREWIVLTDEQKQDMATSYFADDLAVKKALQILDEFEDQLKEKNT